MNLSKLPDCIRRSILFALIICSCVTGFTQANTWTQKASLAGNPRFLATSFSIGGKGYLGLGFNRSVFFKDFWEYDPVADVWTQKADFGGGYRSASAGFSIGNKGYVGTGSSNPSDDLTKDFWEFDPSLNTWTRKADFAGDPRTVAQGLTIGSKGYIGLGRTAGYFLFADFWEYDPGSDTWTRKADFAGGARYATSGFGIGTKGYIGTGTDFTGGGFTFRNDFWQYDQGVDSWTRKADFGGSGRELAVGFSMNNKGYIGAGSYTSDFWEYSPADNTWTSKADFGGGGRNMATGFSIAGKAYVGTGDAGGSMGDLWQYTPSLVPPSTQWVRHPEGSIGQYTYPAISSDLNGNTYITGAFIGSLSFPTLPSPTILTSAGDNDIFIAKYDAAGNVLWAKRAGGSKADVPAAIKYDAHGNIYIAGSFIESATFDGTTLTNPVTSSYNVFIAKYDAATGACQWVRHGAGSDGYYRSALGIAVDNAGDAYITGQFGGVTTSFAPLPALDASNRWWDIFIVKYSAAGVPQWTATAGSPAAGYNAEGGNGIAVDASGKVYITGIMNGSSAEPTQFGNIQLVSNGGGGFYETGYFLAKYNPATATWEWAVNGGGNTNDYGRTVSLDNNGNAYVSGYFEGAANFGSAVITSTDGSDYFVAKYAPDASLAWIHPVAGVGFFASSFSRVDANGALYFAGTFAGSVNIGGQSFTSNGYDNIYVASWNTNGDFQWVKHFPANYYAQISAVEVESNGKIDILSVFAGTETFDCTLLNSASNSDFALAKLGYNSGSDAPSVTASAEPICSGNSVILSVGNAGTADWKWYTGSCGGISAGSGNSITVSPAQTTTYYVRDEGGCAGPGNCAAITIHVNTGVPVIDSLTGPVAPAAVNTSTVVNLKYTSNDVTITSANINWGDGTAVQTIANPPASLNVPHVYTAAGVYTVKASLTNACGITSALAQYQYVVIYDPSAGFVTGGGWINSPAGSFRPDLTLTGKAIFGFESKYQKGATAPIGNTEFKFQVGGMNFKSTNYEWLVIAGSRAQFKGAGTINGTGNYGFILTSVDGDLKSTVTSDQFRIKIWDKNNADAIVYDNQYGNADDASLSTAIAGGSIMIHELNSNNLTMAGYNSTLQGEQNGIPEKLQLQALPNPSNNSFKLVIESSRSQAVSLKVFDVLGRVVESKAALTSNGTIVIGQLYHSGIYFAEIMQGNEKRLIKLVKAEK